MIRRTDNQLTVSCVEHENFVDYTHNPQPNHKLVESWLISLTSIENFKKTIFTSNVRNDDTSSTAEGLLQVINEQNFHSVVSSFDTEAKINFLRLIQTVPDSFVNVDIDLIVLELDLNLTRSSQYPHSQKMIKTSTHLHRLAKAAVLAWLKVGGFRRLCSAHCLMRRASLSSFIQSHSYLLPIHIEANDHPIHKRRKFEGDNSINERHVISVENCELQYENNKDWIDQYLEKRSAVANKQSLGDENIELPRKIDNTSNPPGSEDSNELTKLRDVTSATALTIKSLSTKLSNFPDSLVESIQTILTTVSASVSLRQEQFISQLGLDNLPDDALSVIIEKLTNQPNAVDSSKAEILILEAILPKARSLKAPATRSIVRIVDSLMKIDFNVAVKCFLCPLISSDINLEKSTLIWSPSHLQLELVQRISRQLIPKIKLSEFLEILLSADREPQTRTTNRDTGKDESNIEREIIWSPDLTKLMSLIVSTIPTPSTNVLRDIVFSIEKSTSFPLQVVGVSIDEYLSNASLVSLLHSIVTKYHSSVSIETKRSLRNLLSISSSTLSKVALEQLLSNNPDI